jgi:hypothetical protein
MSKEVEATQVVSPGEKNQYDVSVSAPIEDPTATQ